MDGKGRHGGGGGGEDPLTLTLGSIYSSAPTPPPSPSLVVAPTPPPSSFLVAAPTLLSSPTPVVVPMLLPSPTRPVVFSMQPHFDLVPALPPSSPQVPQSSLSSLSAPGSTRHYRNSPRSSLLAPPSNRRRLNNPDEGQSPRGRGEEANGDNGVLVMATSFPWVTSADLPVLHCTLESMLLKGITSVEGKATCNRCSAEVPIAYDLDAKFREVRDYVAANIHIMDDRAPEHWMCPRLPDCGSCGKKACMWPQIPNEKREINWLFLFLGQMLGCCTLEGLKFFCKNTKNHCTGAKTRVLYYAYIEMCRQLDPQGPFNIWLIHACVCIRVSRYVGYYVILFLFAWLSGTFKGWM